MPQLDVLDKYLDLGTPVERDRLWSLLQEVNQGNRAKLKDIAKINKTSTGCASWEATCARWLQANRGQLPLNVRGQDSLLIRMLTEIADPNPFREEVRGPIDLDDIDFNSPEFQPDGDVIRPANPAPTAPVTPSDPIAFSNPSDEQLFANLAFYLGALAMRARDKGGIAIPASVSAMVMEVADHILNGAPGDAHRWLMAKAVSLPAVVGAEHLANAIRFLLVEAIGQEVSPPTAADGAPLVPRGESVLMDIRPTVFDAASVILSRQPREDALRNLQQLVQSATQGQAPAFMRTTVRLAADGPEQSVYCAYWGSPEQFGMLGFNLSAVSAEAIQVSGPAEAAPAPKVEEEAANAEAATPDGKAVKEKTPRVRKDKDDDKDKASKKEDS